VAQEDELRRAIESAVEAVPPTVPPGSIVTSWPIGTYNFDFPANTQFPGGQVAPYITIGDTLRGQHCNSATLLDLSGLGVTVGDGTADIRLEDFLCRQRGGGYPSWQYLEPFNVVATPRGSAPIYLTYDLSRGGQAGPEITFYAWRSGGIPQGGVRFDWRCRVPIVESA
jgi:hypothetical protein